MLTRTEVSLGQNQRTDMVNLALHNNMRSTFLCNKGGIGTSILLIIVSKALLCAVLYQ